MFWKFTLAVGVAILGAGIAPAYQLARADEAPLIKVAVVRFEPLFRDHRPFVEIDAQLKAELKEIQEKLTLMQAEGEAVVNRIKNTPAGSPENQQLQVQFAKLQAEFRLQSERDQQQWQRKQSAAMLGIFKTIQTQIQRIAKEKGYRLVLRKFDFSLDDTQPNPVLQAAMNQQILFEDCPDITPDVLAALAAESPAASEPK